MASKRKYRSKVAEAVHEGVRGMHRLGLVDKKTMREFDVRCLTPVDDDVALSAALAALAADPERARRLGTRGRATIESSFDICRTSDAWMAAYKDVLA